MPTQAATGALCFCTAGNRRVRADRAEGTNERSQPTDGEIEAPSQTQSPANPRSRQTLRLPLLSLRHRSLLLPFFLRAAPAHSSQPRRASSSVFPLLGNARSLAAKLLLLLLPLPPSRFCRPIELGRLQWRWQRRLLVSRTTTASAPPASRFKRSSVRLPQLPVCYFLSSFVSSRFGFGIGG